MPTTPLTIQKTFAHVLTGPASVLIPAHDDFFWAITAGPAPAIDGQRCPRVGRGDQLSIELVAGESLWAAAPRAFDTSVTSGV